MTNPFDLTGRTILVTGATGGLGRQTAISISQMGATVVLIGRREERLKSVLAELTGEGHVSFVTDLANRVARDELAAKSPPLDGIAHCAGKTLLQPFKFITEEQYEEIYQINVQAPMFLTQKLLKNKLIRPGASLVFVSSISPITGWKGHSIYAGSKAAIVAIARVLAHELAPSRIRANTISPAMIKTEVVDGLSEQMSAEYIATDAARYPLGYGEPEDVANAITFFLSDASKWITGSNLIMDGGLT